ncbi:hypothetical protein HispidOSU_002158 [Sigmodon hispidus]
MDRGLGGGGTPFVFAHWCIAQPQPELGPEAVMRPEVAAARTRWVPASSFPGVRSKAAGAGGGLAGWRGLCSLAYALVSVASPTRTPESWFLKIYSLR